MEWDTEGRLKAVEEDGTELRMVYDADGNRLIRDDGSSVTAGMAQNPAIKAAGRFLPAAGFTIGYIEEVQDGHSPGGSCGY